MRAAPGARVTIRRLRVANKGCAPLILTLTNPNPKRNPNPNPNPNPVRYAPRELTAAELADGATAEVCPATLA